MIPIEPEEQEDPMPVENYEDVKKSVLAFNEGLGKPEKLENQLSYFRAWYYIPDLNAVGPSKFIGYKNLPVARYLIGYGLDGKVTEPILGRWFNLLIEGTPEANYVKSLVEQLASRYHKVMNRKARFNAPRGWRLEGKSVASLQNSIQSDPPTSDRHPLAEVFWQAFLSLSPKDQDTISKRITTHRSGRDKENLDRKE